MDDPIGTGKEMFRNIFGERSVSTFFMTVLILFLLMFVFVGIITGGRSISGFLFDDKSDMFMDFFTSVADSSYLPYTEHHIIYPPLAAIAYKIIAMITIPFATIPMEGYPLALSLRDSQMGMAIYFATVVITLFLFYLLISHIASKDRATKASALLLILFSAPVVCCIERGNSIMFVAALIGFFLIFHRSENKWLRYSAYAALAIASAIKIYPLIFWALLFDKEHIKEAMVGIFISGVLLIVPFVFTDGNIAILLENMGILSDQRGASAPTTIHLLLSETIGPMIGDAAAVVIGYAIVGVMGVLCLLTVVSKHMLIWEKALLCACVLATIPITSVAMYSSIYFIIPTIMFLLCEKDLTRRNIAIAIMLIVILAPLPGILTISWGGSTCTQNILVAVKMLFEAALLLMLISDWYRRYRTYGPKKREVSDADC